MGCCDEKKTLRNEEERKKLINRLNRIEGQIRGIKGMVENDAYCNDILIQSAAVNAAVEQAIKKPASYAVIANPHEEIVKLVELSASRWKKKQQENPEEALASKNSSKKPAHAP